MLDIRNAYRNVVGNPEGESPLGRPKRSWADNIEIVPKLKVGVVWSRFNWLLNTAINFRLN
jgi:hypothetical protein